MTQEHKDKIQSESIHAVENLFSGKPTYPESYCELYERGAAFGYNLAQPPAAKSDQEAWRNLPFDVKHLENNEWPVTEKDSKWMTQDQIQESKKVWQEAEKLVVFHGLHVSWDSCDCGDGYGCSHGNWPYEVSTAIKDEKIEFEDDGIYIEKGDRGVNLHNLKGSTLGDFFDLCKIVGINLSIKPSYALFTARHPTPKPEEEKS